MRALLWIILVAAALWGGYWFAGAKATEQAVSGWFAAQDGRPVAAQHQGIAVRGFPNRFDLTITQPEIRDAETGTGWSAPFAQIFTMTWKPWHLIAALPQEQTLSLPGQDLTISSTVMQGSLVLVPGMDLTLDRLSTESDGITVRSSAGWAVSATSANLATRRAPDSAMGHQIWAELTTVTPDAAFRMALSPLSDLPEQIERLRLDGTVTLSAPVDRHLATTRPDLQALTVKEALLVWGDLTVSGKGDIVPTADGTAEGRIDIRIDNWRKLVPVLVAAGLVTPEVSETVTRAMELMAAQDGTPDVLDVPLVFASGRMSLGPIPLGPAPRLR